MSLSLACKDPYSCQPITNAPLIRAGLSSAAYIVTVAAILGQTRLIGGVKGSHTFGSKTQPHDKSDSKERLPRVCETGSDRGDDQDDGSDEDLSSSAEPVVERVGNCTSVDAFWFMFRPRNSRHTPASAAEMYGAELTKPTFHSSPSPPG